MTRHLIQILLPTHTRDGAAVATSSSRAFASN